MTIDEAKLLKNSDICKDLEKTQLYNQDVFCQVSDVSNDSVTFVAINGKFSECYPWTILFRDGDTYFDRFQKI